MFKIKKQPFLELFIQNIRYLAWPDPSYWGSDAQIHAISHPCLDTYLIQADGKAGLP